MTTEFEPVAGSPDHYDAAYYDANGQAGDRPALRWYVRMVRRYVGQGPYLDFGCGTGHLLRRLAAHGSASGFEISPYSAAHGPARPRRAAACTPRSTRSRAASSVASPPSTCWSTSTTRRSRRCSPAGGGCWCRAAGRWSSCRTRPGRAARWPATAGTATGPHAHQPQAPRRVAHGPRRRGLHRGARGQRRAVERAVRQAPEARRRGAARRPGARTVPGRAPVPAPGLRRVVRFRPGGSRFVLTRTFPSQWCPAP